MFFSSMPSSPTENDWLFCVLKVAEKATPPSLCLVTLDPSREGWELPKMEKGWSREVEPRSLSGGLEGLQSEY